MGIELRAHICGLCCITELHPALGSVLKVSKDHVSGSRLPLALGRGKKRISMVLRAVTISLAASHKLLW